MTDPVVSIKALTKQFRSGGETVTVFRNLDLTLAPGESLALMGPSGSGKSTLLNLLSGLDRWTDGEIRLFGESLTSANEGRWSELRRRAIATVFQEANLMPAMTLAENIRLRASLAGHEQPDTEAWLEDLGLAGLGERYPDQVSGGQRQRAALAMAFAMQPSLILADEPTGSLDRRTAAKVADTLFQFQHRYRCPLILATHDPELAERCDRSFTLDQRG